jgi:hypothetical protein
MTSVTCDVCGAAIRNGYCTKCGVAGARQGDGSTILSTLGAPFRALALSARYLRAPSQAAADIKAGQLTLGSCITAYLAWGAAAFLVKALLPGLTANSGNYLESVDSIGGTLPLVGEIIQFALWAAVFIMGFLPMHLLLRVWKGRTAHFADAFALYLLFGGPFVLLRSLVAWPFLLVASLVIWIPMLRAQARLYGVPTALTVGYYALINALALALLLN